MDYIYGDAGGRRIGASCIIMI